MQPYGVHGRSVGSFSTSRPTLYGWKPSTSLRGSIALDHALGVDLLRQRQLDEDAVDRGIGVERGDAASSSASLASAGRSCANERMPVASVVRRLLRT